VLVEVPPTAQPPAAGRYQLKTAGLPRDVVFSVWGNEFGHGYHELAADLRLDESGALVSSQLDGASRPRPLDQRVFEPGPLPRGAGWEVVIIRDTRTVVAYAKVIPRPIAGRDGLCVVSLELASRRGDRFLVSGSGFTPGETVSIEHTYAGRTLQKNQVASTEGRLPPDVIIHGVGAGGVDHRARYTVRARSCAVVVEYEWGEPALAAR
jgi:hypothetical protein